MTAAAAIRLLCFTRVANVGDKGSPLMVRALTGRLVLPTEDTTRPHLIALGSLMGWSSRASYVWGTGVLGPEAGIGRVKAANVFAVRGKLSHAALRRSGVAVGDVALGDPGYLLPGLLGIARAARPMAAVGLVRHYLDRDDPVLRRLADAPGVLELSVHDEPGVFLQSMAGCGAVLSTSLHGLVFAEALGIPNLWVKAGDRLPGGQFKFHDWFSTMRAPQDHPWPLTEADTAHGLAQRAALHEPAIEREDLLAAFPHDRLATFEIGAPPDLAELGRRAIGSALARLRRRRAATRG